MQNTIIYDYSFGVIPLIRNPEGLMVLLVQHQAGHWGFPKGHKEGDETDEETAIREFIEETGIREICLVEGVQFRQQYTFTKNGQTYHKTVIYFPGYINDYAINLQPEEIKDYKVIPLLEIMKLDFPEDTKKMFSQIIEYFIIMT